ncbi:MAG: AmmeMemoRadiSam system radical SAM enzyme [Chloroflexi bacterium]|nr:AmmeMemoRadiSam system radical SAM enzyme [Chloroflexota bacterium]
MSATGQPRLSYNRSEERSQLAISRQAAAPETREVALYDRLPDTRARCQICLWRCTINPGKLGVCRMRRNDKGTLNVLNYSSVSSMAVDPIEKKPLFHFFPATRVFSLGTWGCNFHCVHCQNWEIACVEQPEGSGRASQYLSPQAAVSLAGQNRCAGIAWTYNEPTIWFEYTLDSARLARQAGLYTVYVTNGYMTPEALDVIGPYLDAWRVDIKGFSDSAYRSLASVALWQEILIVAVRAQEKWSMHIEVVTNVIPGVNDDDEQLRGIAGWVSRSLGELTPWHVTRFYPQHNMMDKPPTPVATLERALNIGKEAGLRFVYVGNVPGHDGENTVCYNCGRLVISRQGYVSNLVGLRGSACKFCGVDLNMRVTTKKVTNTNAGNNGE